MADSTGSRSTDGLSRQQRGRPPWLAVPIILGALSLLTAGYLMSSNEVRVVDDGSSPFSLRTHQRTVEGVLREAGITYFAEDSIAPAPVAELRRGDVVTIKRALPVRLRVDDREPRTLRTQARTAAELLASLGEPISPDDAVVIDGEPRATLSAELGKGKAAPVDVLVRRAVELSVEETGRPTQRIASTAATIGEALMQAGNIIYIADVVKPALHERVQSGMTISIQRSRPVSIVVDGKRVRTRTQQKTVSDVLSELNIALYDQDYTRPALNTPVTDDMDIRVVRLRREVVVEQDLIPFDTRWLPDPETELDLQELAQEGAPGVRERRTLVTLEDGATVKKQLVADFIARDVQPKIYKYGTKVIVRTLDTPNGPVQYWRKIRMLATSYSANTAGVPVTSPWYGKTRCGVPMRAGIVAVDPKLIPLRSNVYVPDYGLGFACDTGSGIKGKRIDLGYEDSNLKMVYRRTDVYVLTPVPAAISYFLED